jgi:hypothetical protein
MQLDDEQDDDAESITWQKEGYEMQSVTGV